MPVARTCFAVAVGFLVVSGLAAAEPTAAERGRKALLEKVYVPTQWKFAAYDNAWKYWGDKAQPGDKAPPQDYPQAFMDRYGLHPAPFDNGRFPMGLREGSSLLFGKGLTNDCLLCHAGSILGKSYIGMGNSVLDIQALFEDLGRGSGSSGKTPFTFSNVRGTSEAGGMAIFLLSHREPNLTLRIKAVDLGLRDDMCEDVPAWWLLKKKKTMYHTGSGHARSVRSLMQFMLYPTNTLATFESAEPDFADIQAYILSLAAPKYPFSVDRELAHKGEKLFVKNCAQCHGTYGENWSYPSKIVPIDVIGTDRARLDGFSARAGDYYNKTWFAKEKRPDGKEGYAAQASDGYQAPPLDGIWASAPYLHNGSVPTVYDMLNSKARPRIYTRSFRTGETDYDAVKLGWKVQVVDRAPENLSPYERRKVYDTTQPGRGNGGHTFGDDFTDDQRRAVIEYLKTL